MSALDIIHHLSRLAHAGVGANTLLSFAWQGKIACQRVFNERLKPLNEVIHTRRRKDDLHQFEQKLSPHLHNTK
ncbi:hypothetical protein ACLE1A_002826 [Cronobacter turicensis]